MPTTRWSTLRRRVLILAVVAAVGATITGARPATPQEGGNGGRRRPNVLIFLTDDQRDGLEVMPALRQKMVHNGRYYPNAYVTTPSCCPSRASIMTGRYMHNHKVKTNRQGRRLDHRTTIQFYLQRAGYRTAYFGKFLNSWPIQEGPPYFNEWAISSPELADFERRYYDSDFNINGDVRRIAAYSTKFIGRKAVRYLETIDGRNDSKPWLMFVAPNAPHPPFIPEKKYEDARVPRWNGNPAVGEEDRSDKPPWVRRKKTVTLKQGRRIRRDQFRMLKTVDDEVRDVFGALERLDEGRRTLVLFISDNGYAWGEHGLDRKFSPYPESTHVPLLLKWPNHVAPGSTDNRLVANIDLAPTILDATGVSPDEGPPLDGRSLLDPSWERDRLLLEYQKHPYFRAPDWAALLTLDAQYTEYYENETVTFKEFYDLGTDPFMLHNVLGDDTLTNDAPEAAVLGAQLQKDRMCVGPTCP